MSNKVLFVLQINLIFAAIIFSIYNTNWGNPYYFHPDERNIASSVSQLRYSEQMNPYYPMYIVYT